MTPAALDRATLVLALGALFVAVQLGTTTCKCSHMFPANAWVLAPAAVVLWACALRGWFLPRAVIAAPIVFALAKTITDTLWDGHEPLLQGAAGAPLLVHPRVAVRLTIYGAFAASALALRWTSLRRAGAPVTPLALLGHAPRARADYREE